MIHMCKKKDETQTHPKSSDQKQNNLQPKMDKQGTYFLNYCSVLHAGSRLLVMRTTIWPRFSQLLPILLQLRPNLFSS